LAATSHRFPSGLAHVAAFVLNKRAVVSGRSMEPTLLPGERVLVNRLAFRQCPPERGDIVLARHPQQPKQVIIKRVAAVPGDHVVASPNGLLVNGQAVLEWDHSCWDNPNNVGARHLGPEEFFLIGDAAELHPAASTDSRSFGPVRRKLILGRVWSVYWPLDHVRRVN